ncbi:MAG: RNA-binding protein, partial [Candidatus Omnitrophota bacterium]
MNIFVGNLSFDVSSVEIEKLFKGFGDVVSAVIVPQKGKKTPKSRGFGFVEMPDESQARAAIAALNGKEFMGRVLKVNTGVLKKEVQQGSEMGKKAWPKREDQSRPWQKRPDEAKPWKKAEQGDRRPWRKTEGEAKTWSKPRR